MHLAPTLAPRTAPAGPPLTAPVAAPGTVLVTGAGGHVGAQVVHLLLERGMRVVTTDITPLPAPRDDFVLGPCAASPSYVPFLEATLARFDVDLLIPTVSDELPALAGVAPVLGSQVAIAAPGPIALCHDRLLTMRYLARHRIPVPTTVVVRPSGVPRHLIGEGTYVARPRLANGPGTATMIDDPEQLPARNDTFLAQELVPGEEIIAQVHRSPRDGVMTVVLLRTSGSGPDAGGKSARMEQVEPGAEPELAELARAVARALDLTGAFSIDMRRTVAGTPVVLAVDARLGAHSHPAPELLDGLLDDAALPLRTVRSAPRTAPRR